MCLAEWLQLYMFSVQGAACCDSAPTCPTLCEDSLALVTQYLRHVRLISCCNWFKEVSSSKGYQLIKILIQCKHVTSKAQGLDRVICPRGLCDLCSKAYTQKVASGPIKVK